MTTDNDDTSLGTIEERAARMGHVPKEEFRGAPDRWVDAETYVRNAENILPHLKGTLNTMERRTAAQERIISDLNSKLDSLKNEMSEFVQFSKGAEERAYNKALKELQAKQRAAAADGDITTYDAVSAELDEHIAQHPAVTGKKVGVEEKKVDPAKVAQSEWYDQTALTQWETDNPWYFKSPDMAAFADQMDRWLGRTKPTQSHAERLAEVTDLVKAKFPENWENPRKAKAPDMASGEGVPADNGKRSYANLPDEAKKQCDKWAGKDGKGTGTMGEKFTRDDYVKAYQWD